ncbi:unnamed protein product [Hyaloperonospora brassicae]|uniref:Uncharacterized protein n=1 Tax=Hyaloperonospora brassicae TaxID=162125 RepID=A0AAV0TMK1_HYABA|nr:unnamed protein product [Hyaloperonospora brassicae]
MTTIVCSSPPACTDAPVALSAGSQSVRVGVSIDAAKDSLGTDSDSPTSSAADLLSLGRGTDVRLDVGIDEERDDDDKENVREQVVGVSHESCAGAAVEPRSGNKRRRVFFECADIVEFEPTVYTTSITSGGVPVGLSLNERSRSRRRLDSFEMERADERVGRQNYMEEGYLDPQEREIILNNAGCDEPAIASVEAEVNAIIQHRRESNEIDYSFMYVVEDEDVEDDEDEEEKKMEEEKKEKKEKTKRESKRRSKIKLEDIVKDGAVTMHSGLLVDREIEVEVTETTAHQCSIDDAVIASM